MGVMVRVMWSYVPAAQDDHAGRRDQLQHAGCRRWLRAVGDDPDVRPRVPLPINAGEPCWPVQVFLGA